MKKEYFICICVLFSLTLHAQKRIVDTSALNWPIIGDAQISSDGDYVAYPVMGGIADLTTKSKTYLWSKRDNKTEKLEEVNDSHFTIDSKYFIYCSKEKLFIRDLVSKKIKVIDSVVAIKVPTTGDGKWIAFQSLDGNVTLYNLQSSRSNVFNKVINYSFGPLTKALVLQITNKAQNSDLVWVNISTGEKSKICKDQQIVNYTFNKQNGRLIILTKNKSGNEIWHWRVGMDSAQIVSDAHTDGLDKEFEIANEQPRFAQDDSKVFFKIHRVPDTEKKDPMAVSVDVWSYKDPFLNPTEQDRQDERVTYFNRNYQVCLDLNTKKMVVLENDSTSLFPGEMNKDDSYYLTSTRVNIDANFRPGYPGPDFYLVNTHSGKKNIIAHQLNAFSYQRPQFSPDGRFVFWYNSEDKNYYCYCIQTNSLKVISNSVTVPLFEEKRDGNPFLSCYGVLGWMEHDAGIFVYDKYDIWLLDPLGMNAPSCITHGYGRKHNIVLRCAEKKTDLYSREIPVISPKENMLVCGLNENTGDNSFFSLYMQSKTGPVQLSSLSGIRYFQIGYKESNINTWILKAKSAEGYVLTSQSATEFPNLEYTNDFKTFRKLSNLKPQEKYNWLTCELKQWKTLDGYMTQGLLYKPENFDSTRKYPVIIYYYQRLTGNLHKFLKPELTDGSINIPWFVSRGYLVFCPDNYYEIGKAGEGAYNSVVSGARYLATFSYVDSSRMAIQGHSFGGTQTNYIVAHTDMFAAACSAAGASDMISMYGNAWTIWVQGGQARMWSAPSENIKGYIDASPVLRAKYVTTPMLLLCNKGDLNNYMQGVEFFTNLSRLGKKVWLLQYDGSGHMVYGDLPTMDFTIRVEQFFDHYLKNAPPPKWMTEVIPAWQKGYETGLELDTSGKQP